MRGKIIFMHSINKVACSGKKPKWLVEHLLAETASLPEIYMTCGTSDSLLPPNRGLAAFFKEKGLNLTYKEGTGAHEWGFWSRSIEAILDWLPLEGANAGVTSGNVGLTSNVSECAQ